MKEIKNDINWNKSQAILSVAWRSLSLKASELGGWTVTFQKFQNAGLVKQPVLFFFRFFCDLVSVSLAVKRERDCWRHHQIPTRFEYEMFQAQVTGLLFCQDFGQFFNINFHTTSQEFNYIRWIAAFNGSSMNGSFSLQSDCTTLNMLYKSFVRQIFKKVIHAVLLISAQYWTRGNCVAIVFPKLNMHAVKLFCLGSGKYYVSEVAFLSGVALSDLYSLYEVGIFSAYGQGLNFKVNEPFHPYSQIFVVIFVHGLIKVLHKIPGIVPQIWILHCSRNMKAYLFQIVGYILQL